VSINIVYYIYVESADFANFQGTKAILAQNKGKYDYLIGLGLNHKVQSKVLFYRIAEQLRFQF
jgi:hypothetical protein